MIHDSVQWIIFSTRVNLGLISSFGQICGKSSKVDVAIFFVIKIKILYGTPTAIQKEKKSKNIKRCNEAGDFVLVSCSRK